MLLSYPPLVYHRIFASPARSPLQAARFEAEVVEAEAAAGELRERLSAALRQALEAAAEAEASRAAAAEAQVGGGQTTATTTIFTVGCLHHTDIFSPCLPLSNRTYPSDNRRRNTMSDLLLLYGYLLASP